MGSGQTKAKKVGAQLKTPKSQNEEVKRQPLYDDDVVEAANLAIAIQKEDLTTNIELFVHCEGLPKMDAFSLTDPMVVAYQDKDDKWIYIDKTEFIAESLNPKFVRTFIVNYVQGKKLKLRFEVYDIDDFYDVDNLSKQEFIGYVECEIDDIVMAPFQSISRTIINKKSNRRRNGLLHIRGAEYDMGGNTIFFQIGCLQFYTKSEIVLRMSYFTDNREWMPIFASTPVKNQKDKLVQFEDFYLPLSKFGNNDQASIKLEIEKYNKTKGTTVLGECDVTLQYLMENTGKTQRMTKNSLIVGQLKLIQVKQHSRYSFLNYIYSGSKLQVILAIEYTNSSKRSHENTQDYPDAIRQTLGILQYFNNENKYPVYGFGAKQPDHYKVVSHCFACSGNIFDPYCYGEPEDIVQKYQEVYSAVTPHGPTILSQIIEKASEFAEYEDKNETNKKYCILLILTDGSVNDIQQTIEALEKAQNKQLPLSVIIIGIGDKDFSNLNILEGEKQQNLTQSKINNESLKRNLVQFVHFNKVAGNQDKLAKEILAQIPKQFLDYMEKKKIDPAKQKKHTKAAKNDFIHQKIDEMKKRKKEPPILTKLPIFLTEQKEEFIRSLKKLGYDIQLVTNIINNDGLACKDINLLIEMMSNKYKPNPTEIDECQFINRSETAQKILSQIPKTNSRVIYRVLCFKQTNKLDQVMLNKKQETKMARTNFLFSIQEKEKPKQQLNPIKVTRKEMFKNQLQQYDYENEKKQTGENLCLYCENNQIEIVFLPCGHACCCLECLSNYDYCIGCRQKIQTYVQIK